MSTNQQYNPEVDLTIFPRVNFYQTFGSRFNARAANGRIFGATATAPTAPTEAVGSTLSDLTDGTFTGITAEWSGGSNPTYSYNWSFLASGASAATYLGDWIEYDGTQTTVVLTPSNMGAYRLVSRAVNAGSIVYYYSYSTNKYVGN